MQSENRITWEKLAIELELLASEDPATLIQLMAALNGWLCPHESLESTNRALNFMTYELMAQGENLSEAERFDLLNDYYFRQKGFLVLQLKSHETTEDHLLLKPVVERRSGAPIAITLIYLHLAAHLDLPAYLIQLRNHYLLKWVRGGHSSYVDLCAEGRLVTEEELMGILSRTVETQPGPEALSIVPNRKTFLRYADDLMRVYERLQSRDSLHAIYNVILRIEPQNNRILARRAILRRDLGQDKDALADLKRYFAFVDRNQAPPDLVRVFHELNGRNGAEGAHGRPLLH
jgi:regulator of sirC expression with transglutaminase-like and TPR domain